MTNRSAPPGPVVPVLIYNDVSRAIEWLCGAFGFTERLRTAPEPDGSIHHAQLGVGMGSVVLTGQRSGGSGQSVFVPVLDADAHWERARQFGARILDPPATRAFGERQYSAQDPEGNRWTFSQSVADVNPEEWGARVAALQSPLELLPRPRLCYLQIPAIHAKQSAAFYEPVFGWNIRHRDSSHPSFDDATGYVSGAWVTDRPAATDTGLLPYIDVDDIETVLARVTVAGGEVIEGRHLDSPEGEWIATFRDPAGNVIGLHQARSNS